MSAFNSAYKQYGGDEEKAFRVAWAAVAKLQGEQLHPDFKRILNTFTRHFGDEDGAGRFGIFLDQNSLDPAKAYNPAVQFTESFSWVEPLISFYKQDKQAKYYLVRALTANISMNNNDYSDWQQMQQAAKSLSDRPVNINHDHTRWLPYPRTRVDFTRADDLSVEATLRVDNADAWLQRKLDEKEILHPSIEGRPDPAGGYHFNGLALLEKNAELPGDPLTEIQPLFLNESISKAACRLIDGKLVCECQANEVKEKMSTPTKEMIEAMTPEDCIAKIKDIQTQLNEISNKLYPQSKLTEEQKKALYDQQRSLATEMDLYKTALSSMLQMNTPQPCCKCEGKDHKIADLTEELTRTVNEKTQVELALRSANESNAALQEKFAKHERLQIEKELAEKQAANYKEQLVAAQSESNELRGKIEAKSVEISKLEEHLNREHAALTRTEETLGRREAELEEKTRELNDESTKRAAAEQKALNETKERSRIQLENAQLREDLAKQTREASDYAEKRSNDAHKLLEQEQEIKTLKENVQKLNSDIAEKQKSIERALQENKRVYKILKANNIYEVDAAGNVIIPP